MSQWERIKFAAIFGTIFSIVFIILAGFIAPDLMSEFISHPYGLVVLIVAYMFAPILRRFFFKDDQ